MKNDTVAAQEHIEDFDAEDFDTLEPDESEVELEQLLARVEAARYCGA